MSFSWKKMFKKIGPGFITGAADDDPSGIATYSIAGSRFGYKMTWLSLFLIPSMIAVQEMCGRVGMSTGRGLASVIRKYVGKKMMWFSIALLAFANIVNIGADLGIMASSLKMVFGLPFYFWLFAVAMSIVVMEIWVPYKRYSSFLKWLAMTLFVYVITALVVKQNWLSVFNNLLIPRIEWNSLFIMSLVGFAGTTISPYLFFWQSAEEVEDEIDEGRIVNFEHKPRVSKEMIAGMRFDTKVGMIFSSVIAFFIVVTTAGTLHANGIYEIAGAKEAAEALRPLAGDMAYILFALGIVGIGLQAVPVLAGSLAYAFAEGLGIEEGLNKKFSKAKGFYLILVLATMVGVLMNVWGINTMQALYYSAIVNGVVSVPLIYIIMKLADDERVVGEFKTEKKYRIIGWLTFGFMALAVILMFINFGM